MAGRVISIALLAQDRMSRAFNDAAESADDFADQLGQVDRSARKASVSLLAMSTSTRGLKGLRTTMLGGTAAVAGLGVASAGTFAAIGGGATLAAAKLTTLGIKLAAQNQEVKASYTAMFKDVQSQATKLADPFVAPLLKISTMAGQTFGSIAPQLGAAFSALAPALVPLAAGVSGMAKNLATVLQPLAQVGASLFTSLGPALTQFGANLAAFAKPILEAVNQVSSQLWPVLLGGIGQVLTAVGPLITTFTQVGATLLGPLLSAVSTIVGALGSALAPALKVMAPVFNQLVSAVAPLVSQLVTGLSPILTGLAPILSNLFSTLAPVISALLTGLQPVISSLAPVIGVLVGALGKILTAVSPILPPLGNLIASLVNGLMPVLTPIIGLVASTAASIGTALVGALVQAMPAVQSIVAAVGSLLPALAPTIPLFGELLRAVIPIIPPVAQLAAALVTALVPVLRIAIGVLTKVQGVILKAVIPVVRLLATGIGWVATKVAEGVTKLGAWFTRLHNEYVKPKMDAVASVIRGAWNNHIRPAFDLIKLGVGKVKTAFSTAVDGIGKVWDKIKDIAKKPVNFIIGTVYNKGILGLVKKIAGFAGIPFTLKEIPQLAKGGTLANPAKAGPMVTNGPIAIAGEGRRQHPEFVIPTDPRYRSRAQSLWAQAGQQLAGKGGGSMRMGGEGMFFERGGIIGSFMDKLKGFDFLDPAKAFKNALGKLTGAVPGSGVFRDVVSAIPGKFVSWLVEWFKSKVGMGGSPGMRSALNWAKGQAGKPYVWGGVGPGGYDCSGWISAITNVIKGRNPYSRLFTTFSFTGADRGPEGFRRGAKSGFELGITNAGVGHMAGTLLGKNVESSGSAGVRVGGGARGAGDGLFNMRYGLKADTGALSLAPGWNPPTFNGTGRMEYLETPRRDSGRPIEVVLQLDGRVIARQIVNPLREDVRNRGRGNVQTYLGQQS